MEEIRGYLQEARLMQLATVSNGQPWICTVYYVVDDSLNFYWLSLPTRRHSRELEADKAAAATVVIKADLPVIGIQVEGIAEKITDTSIIQKIMPDYVAKYDKGQDFYDNYMAGKNQHVMYKLTPKYFYLIDELNHPGAGRKEISDFSDSKS